MVVTLAPSRAEPKTCEIVDAVTVTSDSGLSCKVEGQVISVATDKCAIDNALAAP